jgi:hypothetical protein
MSNMNLRSVSSVPLMDVVRLNQSDFINTNYCNFMFLLLAAALLASKIHPLECCVGTYTYISLFIT